MSDPRTYSYDTPHTVPAGQVVVHNRVRARRLPEDDWYEEKGEGFRDQGEAGFRFWLQAPGEGPPVEPCDCGWAPHLQAHYRVVLAK
jgi:hypothetical protein